MELWIDCLIVLLILTNLKLISSSRLSACIRVVAIQGVLLGLVPLLVGSGDLTFRVILLSIVTMVVKGIVFPWLLLKALRSANVRREMEPFVGYTTSLLVGVGLLALAIWMGRQLPLPAPSKSPLVVPLALFTIMIGLFAIVSRRKALTQVLGYLVMENGIYAFGLAFAHQEPLLVELGTLLDVFMAVFIMGITIFQINREFDHIDTDRLSLLKD
ncbi:MAG: hydrogenase [Deltaproteobacteria bacterium]|nr:hydrogenase [Deltaproteobacteria bacterium]